MTGVTIAKVAAQAVSIVQTGEQSTVIARAGNNVTIVQGVAAAGPPGAAGSLTGTAGGDLTGTYPNPTIGTGKVTSTNILDGTIVDGDINASAGIALTKLASIAASTILGNNTGGAATPSALTAAQVKTLLAIATGDVSGLGTSATLASDADGTLAANSDTRVATQKATKTYADGMVPKSTVTTKGDLIAATGSAAVSRVAVGADGKVVKADSTQSAGISYGWAFPDHTYRPKTSTTYLTYPGLSPYTLNATFGFTNDRIYYYPVVFESACTISSWSIQVTTNVAGKNVNTALIVPDKNLQPSSVLASSGSIDVSTTGVKTYTPGSPISVTPGVYLVGVWCDSASVVLRATTGTTSAMGIFIDPAGLSSYITALYVSKVYSGTWPTPSDAWTAVLTATNMPAHVVAFAISDPTP